MKKTQKKVERVGGWDMTNEEAFQNPNGRPGLSAGYGSKTGTAGGGDADETMIREGKAHAHATTVPGKTNDSAEALATTLSRGERLQSNPEKVRTVNPDANKGLAKRLAGANDDGNPKHRTQNVSGGPTVGKK